MAYQDTTALERQVQALLQSGSGNSWGAGLADGIKMWAAARANKKIETAEKNNEQNRSRELAMLLKGAETGRVGDNYVSARLDQYSPTDPEVQKLATQLRLQRVTDGEKQTDDMREFGYSKTNPGFADFLRQNRRTADPSDLDSYMGMNEADRAVALEFKRNPYLDQGNQYTNTTRDEVIPRNLRPGEEPAVRGLQREAAEAAETAAMPEQLAIQNAAAAQRDATEATAPLRRNAEQALSLLDMAEPLLATATGSGLGAMRDTAGAMFGVAGEGAEAAAQLKAIGGLIISKMPRMEGPQSDRDTQMYREMAGQIGDPTIPNETRLAALQTLRELQQKYLSTTPATPAAVPAPAATAPGTVLRFDSQGNPIQ